MLEIRFADLIVYEVVPNRQGSGVWYFPYYELTDCDWIVYMINVVAKTNAQTMKEPDNFDYPRQSDKHPVFHCKLMQTWHIASCVMYACQLYGILYRTYIRYRKELGKLLGDALPQDHEPSIREEFKVMRIYRNKVFAHTSYSRPDDDSPALQMASLSALTASRCSYDGETGAISLRIEWNSGTDNGLHLGFEEAMKFTRSMGESWYRAFKELNDCLRRIPISTLSGHWDAVLIQEVAFG